MVVVVVVVMVTVMNHWHCIRRVRLLFCLWIMLWGECLLHYGWSMPSSSSSSSFVSSRGGDWKTIRWRGGGRETEDDEGGDRLDGEVLRMETIEARAAVARGIVLYRQVRSSSNKWIESQYATLMEVMENREEEKNGTTLSEHLRYYRPRPLLGYVSTCRVLHLDRIRWVNQAAREYLAAVDLAEFILLHRSAKVKEKHQHYDDAHWIQMILNHPYEMLQFESWTSYTVDFTQKWQEQKRDMEERSEVERIYAQYRLHVLWQKLHDCALDTAPERPSMSYSLMTFHRAVFLYYQYPENSAHSLWSQWERSLDNAVSMAFWSNRITLLILLEMELDGISSNILQEIDVCHEATFTNLLQKHIALGHGGFFYQSI